jgi:hypothetical protein
MLMQVSVGAGLIVATVIVHAIGLEFILKVLVAVRTNLEVSWRAVTFSLVILAVFMVHIVEICIWAAFYYFKVPSSEIPTLEAAVYFSTSCFTTVGFGDVVLSDKWRMLSGFEAIDGMILFGWSTAFIFTVVRRVYTQIYSATAHS